MHPSARLRAIPPAVACLLLAVAVTEKLIIVQTLNVCIVEEELLAMMTSQAIVVK